MNHCFHAWTSGAAFQLSLSTAQMKAIHSLANSASLPSSLLEPMTLFALDRRGVTERNSAGDVRLTNAGALLAGLISEAGFRPDESAMATALDRARRSDETVGKALRMQRQGRSMQQISDTLGVSKTTVHRWLHAD